MVTRYGCVLNDDGEQTYDSDGDVVMAWSKYDTNDRIGTHNERRYFTVVRDGVKVFYDNPEAWCIHCEQSGLGKVSNEEYAYAKQAWLDAARDDWVLWASSLPGALPTTSLCDVWKQHYDKTNHMLFRGEGTSKATPVRERWGDDEDYYMASSCRT